MDFFLLATLLLALSVFLYLEELVEDAPDILMMGVYVLAALVAFIHLNFISAAG